MRRIGRVAALLVGLQLAVSVVGVGQAGAAGDRPTSQQAAKSNAVYARLSTARNRRNRLLTAGGAWLLKRAKRCVDRSQNNAAKRRACDLTIAFAAKQVTHFGRIVSSVDDLFASLIRHAIGGRATVARRGSIVRAGLIVRPAGRPVPHSATATGAYGDLNSAVEVMIANASASSAALLSQIASCERSGPGLNHCQQVINILGNNWANANTPGYKSQTNGFSELFYATLSTGSPGGPPHGCVPVQTGFGCQS